MTDKNTEINTEDLVKWREQVSSSLKKQEKKKGIFWDIFKKQEKKEIEDNIIEKKNWNIFDEFNSDNDLIEEVNKIKNENNKDFYYYLSKVSNLMQIIIILWILLIGILYVYIYIQNKVFEEKKDNQILDPFCSVLLGDIHYDWNFCTSISTLKKDYENELSNLKKNEKESILQILEKLYKIENFTKTKEVVFLKEKTNNKLKVLELLTDFDNLKYNFDKVDKEKIECSNITIDEKKNIMSMTCSAYSAWYESWIRWFDWKNDSESLVKWTSISVANSFLNYIHLESKKFTIVNRQKVFSAERIVWDKTWFTFKTTFNLSLKYKIK
jgi:hypothetical protein